MCSFLWCHCQSACGHAFFSVSYPLTCPFSTQFCFRVDREMPVCSCRWRSVSLTLDDMTNFQSPELLNCSSEEHNVQRSLQRLQERLESATVPQLVRSTPLTTAHYLPESRGFPAWFQAMFEEAESLLERCKTVTMVTMAVEQQHGV